jgi:hypothetical protein
MLFDGAPVMMWRAIRCSVDQVLVNVKYRLAMMAPRQIE